MNNTKKKLRNGGHYSQKKIFLKPRLRNWNENMSSSMVATRFLSFLWWWWCASLLPKPFVAGELVAAKLIDLIMLSSNVVKNSEASSCLPTPNTVEISTGFKKFFQILEFQHKNSCQLLLMLMQSELGLAHPLHELKMSHTIFSTSHNEQKPLLFLNLHAWEWGLETSHWLSGGV